MNRCLILAHCLAARRRFTAFPDRRALESWQAAKLRRHLRLVSERSPYYREWFYRPTRGSSEILSSWPRVDKRTMTDNLDRWLTQPVDLAAARITTAHAAETRDFARTLPGGVTVGLSSGTTGPATMFLVSPRERAAWAGLALARVMRKLSARRPQRVAFFLRANSPLYESVGSRALRFEYFDLQRPFAQLTDELQTLAPTMIVAPPSLLRLIAVERLAGRLRIAPARIIAVAEVSDADDRAAVGKSVRRPHGRGLPGIGRLPRRDVSGRRAALERGRCPRRTRRTRRWSLSSRVDRLPPHPPAGGSLPSRRRAHRRSRRHAAMRVRFGVSTHPPDRRSWRRQPGFASCRRSWNRCAVS